jgi:hypothetical protein
MHLNNYYIVKYIIIVFDGYINLKIGDVYAKDICCI